MKIVVAADSFKNCLDSKTVALAIEEGIKRYNDRFEVIKFSTCDGGEGTIDSLIELLNGEYVFVETVDAYGEKIKTKYGLIDNGEIAIIEIASIIGLCVNRKKYVMNSSSRGIAKVMLDAKKKGVKKIIITLGGSATNDVGTGMLEELGMKFYDYYGMPLKMRSGILGYVSNIDRRFLESFEGIEIVVACDVKNKLLGENGCTYCFGKQKGILPSKMAIVDECMERYTKVVAKRFNIDLTTIESGGAAGGIAAALVGFYNAKIVSGIDLFMELSNIEESIKTCDLVITGEGQTDFQTKFGKVPMGLLRLANRYDKPTLIISGALGKGYQELYDYGFVGIVSIADRAMNFNQALSCAFEKISDCVYSQIRIIDYFKTKK